MHTSRAAGLVLALLYMFAVSAAAQPISREFRDSVSKQTERQNLQRDVPVKKSPRVDRATKGMDITNGSGYQGPNYDMRNRDHSPWRKRQMYERQNLKGRSIQGQ